ncbi:DUF4811 domain-containing protein [Fructilactobacillus cliffordii]|uniref:DUF4811 domain-containing protein n=1 Tax=Fructilactobacillus cliffordii TaxID=2940299 RepID=A0A9Q8ZSF4_9LACO|nr:DUF4811 domain-containing protein [Fructilactobacillus cliffordii]USS88799.1 DUF4811 domain-containing protein [Fructilactobacillus cliffordii]
MIFMILIGTVLAFFLCFNLISNHKIANLTGAIAGLLVILTVLSIIGNFHDHLGMKKATVTTTQSFTSINKQMNMVLYQKLGKQGKEQVVIYKKSASQKKPTTTPAINTKNIIHHKGTKNKLVTQKQEWVYKNGFYRMMFGLAQKETFIKRTNTFYVANDYLVMTPKQAKEFGQRMKQAATGLQKQQQNPNSQMVVKQQAQQYIQGKMQAEMQKNPQLSDQQRQKLMKKWQAEFQAQMKQKAQQKLVQQVAHEMNLK